MGSKRSNDIDLPREHHGAIMECALVFLPIAFRMPEGSQVRSAHIDPLRPDVLLLHVEHPSLPLTREGEQLCRVSLWMHDDGRQSEFDNPG